MKKTGDMKEAGDLKKDRGYEKGRMHEKDKKNSRHQGTRVGSKEKSRRRKAPVLPENPLFLLEGAALIGVIAYLFYDSPVAAVVLLPLLYPYYRRRSGEKRRQEKKELSTQFREALAAIITALKAGYSAENAFVECLREMQFQFGEKAAITNEMKRIGKGIENRIPLEKLLLEFASRWQIEELTEFAEVFAIARRSGGNLPDILGRTAEVIRDRMEIDTEIDILLSSRKFDIWPWERRPSSWATRT